MVDILKKGANKGKNVKKSLFLLEKFAQFKIKPYLCTRF